MMYRGAVEMSQKAMAKLVRRNERLQKAREQATVIDKPLTYFYMRGRRGGVYATTGRTEMETAFHAGRFAAETRSKIHFIMREAA